MKKIEIITILLLAIIFVLQGFALFTYDLQLAKFVSTFIILIFAFAPLVFSNENKVGLK